jgi:hypothetical protein
MSRRLAVMPIGVASAAVGSIAASEAEMRPRDSVASATTHQKSLTEPKFMLKAPYDAKYRASGAAPFFGKPISLMHAVE